MKGQWGSASPHPLVGYVYLRGYVDAMLSMRFAQRGAGGAKMDFSSTGLSSHNFGFEQNLDLVGSEYAGGEDGGR